MQRGLALAEPARPEPVHQNAIAVPASGLLINSLDCDAFDGGRHSNALLLYFRAARCALH
jgi:hypothetical protein